MLVFPAHVLVAVAIGILAGALVRRTIVVTTEEPGAASRDMEASALSV